MGQVLGVAPMAVTFLPFGLPVPSFTSLIYWSLIPAWGKIAGRGLPLHPEGDSTNLMEESGD